MASSTALKSFSNAASFLSGSRIAPKQSGVPTSQQMMASDAERVTCFVIVGPKNSQYWAAVLTLMYTVLLSMAVPVYTKAGFVLSFLMAAHNDPAAGLMRIAKTRGFTIRIILFKIENAVIALAKDDEEGKIILASADQEADKLNSTTGATVNDIDPTDLSKVLCSLSAYVGVIRQILFLAAKAVTSAGDASAYADRKMAALTSSGVVDGSWLMGSVLSRIMIETIAGSYNLRIGIVQIIQDADFAGSGGGEVLAAFSQTGQFLKNAGMTGLDLVVRHLVLPKHAILGLSVLAAEVTIVLNLLESYRLKGSEAPFIKFIVSAEANTFSPGGFPNLYAIALGIASVIDPHMGAYGANSAMSTMKFYQVGVKIGTQMKGAISQQMVDDLELDPAVVQEIADVVKEEGGSNTL